MTDITTGGSTGKEPVCQCKEIQEMRVQSLAQEDSSPGEGNAHV